MLDARLVAAAGAEASDLDVTATARGLAWRARAQWFARAKRLRLSSLTGRGKGAAIQLLKPANLDFGAGQVSVDELTLAANAGRLSVTGAVGSSLDARVTMSAIPLGLADLAAPGLGLEGTLAGTAALKGAASAPEGEWTLKIDALSTPATRDFGAPPIAIAASGRLAGGRSSLEANLEAAKAGVLRLTGSVPLAPAGALDVKATGRCDLALANRALSARGGRLGGTLTLDAAVAGDLAHPLARGEARIAGGAFSDESRGFKLEAIEAVLSARGEEIELSRFHASTPHGGAVTAEGRVRLDAAAGFPGAFRFTGHDAQLVSTDVVSASAGFAIDVGGALARAPKIAGRVDLDRMDINRPGSLSGDLRPLPGARHIAPGPTARARLAMAARESAAVKSAAPFDAALELTISAPSRVFLRGRGVDAELGGILKVAGSSNAPRMSGGFDLRRGLLKLLGSELTFSRGRVDFRGDVTPELDLTAQTTAAEITAYVNITGPAAKPVFAFTSSPTLPQDEILSRVLFQKASGNLSACQALQLANAVASLTGNGDAFERLRKSLGVDSLDVGTSASGGPTVAAQRAINDRLSVGVKSGARPEDNGVTLDLDVTKHLRLQGGLDAKGGSTVGAGAQWEY